MVSILLNRQIFKKHFQALPNSIQFEKKRKSSFVRAADVVRNKFKMAAVGRNNTRCLQTGKKSHRGPIQGPLNVSTPYSAVMFEGFRGVPSIRSP